MARKILLMITLSLIVVGGAAAQTQGFSIGARVIGIKPSYEPSSDFKNAAGSVKMEGGIGLGFAAQASYNFIEMFGVQAEALYNSYKITTKGMASEFGAFESTIEVTSILIPILARVGTTIGNDIQLTGLAGVYFTIPIGDAELSGGGASIKYDWKGPMGAMFGGVVGYGIGSGTLFADVRYGFDISEVEFTSEKMFKKSAIHFGIGYSISLGGF